MTPTIRHHCPNKRRAACLAAAGLIGLGLFWHAFDLPTLPKKIQDRSPSSRNIAQDDRPLHPDALRASNRTNPGTWSKIEKEREIFYENFALDTRSGFTRPQWINSPVIRFWMDRLSSPDPEQAELAIQMLERVAALDPMDRYDSDREPRYDLSAMELEGFGIRQTLDMSKHSLLSSRRTLNGVLEREGLLGRDDLTTDEIIRIEEISNNVRFRTDSDDFILLEDAQPLFEVFIPRLESDDPETAALAWKVLDMFTFGVFPEADAGWWRGAQIVVQEHLENQ